MVNIKILTAARVSDTNISFTAVVRDSFEGSAVSSKAIDTIACFTNGIKITCLKHSAIDTSRSLLYLSYILVPPNVSDSVTCYSIKTVCHALVKNASSDTFYLKNIGLFYHYDSYIGSGAGWYGSSSNEIMLVAFNNIQIDAKTFVRIPIINSSNSRRPPSQNDYSIKRDRHNIIVEQRATDDAPKHLVIFDSRGRCLQKINLFASKRNAQLIIPLSSPTSGFIIMAIQDKNGVRTIPIPDIK
jgi:hypothetical protein